MTIGDYNLVIRASRGDAGAFAELVRQHSNLVYRVALRIVGEGEAQDASQEVWVRVWRGIEGFRAESAFSTWLYKVTVNTCLSERRREPARTSWDQGDSLPYLQEQPGGDGDPEAATLGRERMDEALRGLQQIRSEHRASLVLHHLEGLSYPEVAEILEVPEGTAKGWASRGRAELLVILARGNDARRRAEPEREGGEL